jgi:hypothetical protein
LLKKKAGIDFGRIFLTNSVTLATRVRIDILKAIARKFSSEREDLYMTAFSARPVLQVKQKNEQNRTMALTFADAISKFREGLREGDLGEAYRRAGLVFRGQLQQIFVVLHDERSSFERNPARSQGAVVSNMKLLDNAQKKRVREGEC